MWYMSLLRLIELPTKAYKYSAPTELRAKRLVS
jgi:hypothetical protein